MAKAISTTTEQQQREIESVGLATRAVITEYTGVVSQDVPLLGSFNPNGQRDEKLTIKNVKVTKADRVNRKDITRDSIEINEAQMHDVYAVVLAFLKGNFIHAFMEPKNAQIAGMDSEMVARATFEGIVTRNQNYWGVIPRAMIDRIPLLQWVKDDKYGAVISLSPKGIKWVDDVLKPDRIALQWERVLDTAKEPKETTPKFKYTCLCEIDGKLNEMISKRVQNSTCNDCGSVWILVTA